MRSHAAGNGPEVEREVVRAMMLLRLSTLATGHTGIRPETAQTMAAMLTHGITPIVHEHGSLGCSGDLAPLAHCALAVMGEGTVRDATGKLCPAAEELVDVGLRPVELAAKEGLALINGTDGMLGMLILAQADLAELLKVADVAAAMSVEALLGTDRVSPKTSRPCGRIRDRWPARPTCAASSRALPSWRVTAVPTARWSRTRSR